MIRAKLGLLELAQQLGDVPEACRVPGCSRDSFRRFRDLCERGGGLALAEMTKAKPNLRNRVAPEFEAAVAAIAVGGPPGARRGWPTSCASAASRCPPSTIARKLIAEMPELAGSTAARSLPQIASPAGLAPWTRQSGQWKGRSCIGGGRASVRAALHVGAITASRYNPVPRVRCATRCWPLASRQWSSWSPSPAGC